MTVDTFDYDGTTYTVTDLYLTSTATLEFALSPSPTAATVADLTLNIGDSPFPLSSATESGIVFRWASSGLTWAADSDSISVSLTEGAVSDDATLSALSLSGVTLSPSFAADTLAYTGSVDNALTSTTVTAKANDDGATVAIVPADLLADATDGHQVALDVGDTTISATVTAEDGTTTQTYTVTVTRAEAVELNTAPAFTTGAEFSTNENQFSSFQVTAMDADAGDEVTYAITGGTDQVLFTSGVLTFRDVPDHENPTDAGSNNTYLVTVTATGGRAPVR